MKLQQMFQSFLGRKMFQGLSGFETKFPIFGFRFSKSDFRMEVRTTLPNFRFILFLKFFNFRLLQFLLFGICYFQFLISNLVFAFFYLQFAICCLFAIYNLNFLLRTIYRGIEEMISWVHFISGGAQSMLWGRRS